MTRKLLKSVEAAELLGICTKTLGRLVAHGDIAYIRMGIGLEKPRRMFHPDDLEAFIEGRRRRDYLPGEHRERRRISIASQYHVIDFTKKRAEEAKEKQERRTKQTVSGPRKRGKLPLGSGSAR